MSTTAVLRSEWIKIRSIRSGFGSLVAVLGAALAISLAVFPAIGQPEAAVVGAAALAVGVVAGFVMFFTANAFLGPYAVGIGEPGALRSCFGAGLYLALITLFSMGLTFLLRSAVAVLSLLIPFILIVSFVIGGVSEGAATWLPDRAGQQILFQEPLGTLGAWTGIGVTGLWTAAALLAGWWSLRRRDA